jgi:hypothetical protein
MNRERFYEILENTGKAVAVGTVVAVLGGGVILSPLMCDIKPRNLEKKQETRISAPVNLSNDSYAIDFHSVVDFDGDGEPECLTHARFIDYVREDYNGPFPGLMKTEKTRTMTPDMLYTARKHLSSQQDLRNSITDDINTAKAASQPTNLEAE